MKLVPLFLVILSMPLVAQDYASSVPLPIWEAPIPESQGHFTVSLNSICSIAVEQYTLKYDGKSYPVTEFSIETVGGKTARFYHIDEDKADREKEKQEEKSPFMPVKEAASIFLPENDEEKASQKYRVVKVYPQSAISGTVEYRVRSKSEVLALYRNLREAWIKWAP